MSAQRFDFCVDPIPGVWLYFAGHHKSLADKGISHIGAGRRRLISLNAHQSPQLRPDRPVFLAAEPLMDIPVQRFSEVRELCKIKALAHGRFKFRKVSAEPLADGFAGGAAHHRDMDTDVILPQLLEFLQTKDLALFRFFPVALCQTLGDNLLPFLQELLRVLEVIVLSIKVGPFLPYADCPAAPEKKRRG